QWKLPFAEKFDVFSIKMASRKRVRQFHGDNAKMHLRIRTRSRWNQMMEHLKPI
ncbi:hypothetical protein BaRGS_00000737, partial [Batillaria attramentaria]